MKSSEVIWGFFCMIFGFFYSVCRFELLFVFKIGSV
nr:MAG TPA: transmembrane protein [Caudoviricetes sp.]